jgi:aryl-alcohol dehydrogenase-like predicted oxidoreductase
MMKHRNLGKNGPKVSALGLGCMGMSELYGPADEKSGFEVIHKAYECGINFFDTADMYGKGNNEILLGNAIKAFRDKIIIATKCGIERIGDDMRFNNAPEYIKKACYASLKRLKTDLIDVYYLHRYNPEIPIEISMGAMSELIQEGKIRYVGLSEVDREIIERAYHVLGDSLVAVQSEYSIVNRKAAEAALPTCRKLGISFVPFSPIARGLLSGKIKDTKVFSQSEAYDFRKDHPQFQPDTYKTNMHLVEAISNVAIRKNCTPAQLSLAWLLAQGDDIVPIPGTRRLHYLLENIGALDIHMTKDDMDAIEKVMRDYPVEGKHYPDGIMNMAYLKF